MMVTQYIHENWNMRIVGEPDWRKAVVPGSVVADLSEAGVLPDPYYRDNEMQALDCMKNDFEYVSTFSVSKELLSSDEILLQFEGIDTVADIFLNGTQLSSVKNMHRTYTFPVTKLCRETDNELRVLFHSPTNYIKEAYKNDPVDGCEECSSGFVHLRKAHYMFGWDWGPRIPDAGIWRPVKLLGVKKGRISQVTIHQEHEKKDTGTRVELFVSASVIMAGSTEEVAFDTLSGVKLRTKVTGPDGDNLLPQPVPMGEHIGIFPAKLWWPNGSGEQPLYTVTVELTDEEGTVLDSVTKRIGLRTMTMNTAKDEYGNRFAHTVNGVELFAMGADYIPEDNIISRMNRERTYTLLRQCADANFNCIRVWGGGFYPGEDFYDACDELGLMVWQDFMFACGHYRLTEEFKKEIRAELIDNIRRIRHHASLGLLCGNNEMELFVKSRNWNCTDALAEDYLKMYETMFPEIMKAEAPDVFYWPASPSSGGGFDEPNDENRGDVHYWEVWHGNRPFTEYRTFFFRYLSEFGFQSFPSVRTIETFTEPTERNIFSYVMEKHQRNAAANGKILGYLAQMYLYPTEFSRLVYASQLLQAEAIKYGVEHFRRNRGRCMGTVYWQLNDCWPVASWASIDYYGRWKALHYFAKRFFAPLLFSVEENGLLGTVNSVNDEVMNYEKSARFCVTNDTMTEQKVTAVWEIRNAAAEILESHAEELTVPAHTAVSLKKKALPEFEVYAQYLSYRLIDAQTKETVSEGTVLLCPPKHFRWQDPKLSVRVEGDEIVVSAACYAKSVHIQNRADDLLLSDNFFDMNGGEKRVKVLSGSTEGLEVESVYDIR